MVGDDAPRPRQTQKSSTLYKWQTETRATIKAQHATCMQQATTIYIHIVMSDAVCRTILWE